MSDNEQPFCLPDSQQALNVIELSMAGWALSMEVWMRHGFGSRYVGIQGMFGALAIIGYAVLWREFDVSGLLWFLLFFLAMLLIRRMQALRKSRYGERNHSRYSGVSLFAKKFPNYSEIKLKQWFEPIYAVLMGMLICPFSMPLGTYFIIGAFMIRWNIDRTERWTRIRVQEMNDAVCDHEAIAYRFRELRGDNF